MDATATQLLLDMVSFIDERVALALEERCESVNNGYLNVDEAAAYLACSRKRIYDLVQTEKITPERDGRRLLFRESVLDAYVGGSAG